LTPSVRVKPEGRLRHAFAIRPLVGWRRGGRPCSREVRVGPLSSNPPLNGSKLALAKARGRALGGLEPRSGSSRQRPSWGPG
jgi:hypothetical protein